MNVNRSKSRDCIQEIVEWSSNLQKIAKYYRQRESNLVLLKENDFGNLNSIIGDIVQREEASLNELNEKLITELTFLQPNSKLKRKIDKSESNVKNHIPKKRKIVEETESSKVCRVCNTRKDICEFKVHKTRLKCYDCVLKENRDRKRRDRRYYEILNEKDVD